MLEADNTGSPLEDVETQIPKAEPEGWNGGMPAPLPRSISRLTALQVLWFASFPNIKSGHELPAQGDSLLPGRHSPDGPRPEVPSLVTLSLK